jgi:hypothetical protein
MAVLLWRVGSGPDEAITRQDEPACGLIATFPELSPHISPVGADIAPTGEKCGLVVYITNMNG